MEIQYVQHCTARLHVLGSRWSSQGRSIRNNSLSGEGVKKKYLGVKKEKGLEKEGYKWTICEGRSSTTVLIEKGGLVWGVITIRKTTQFGASMKEICWWVQHGKKGGCAGMERKDGSKGAPVS